MIPNKMSKQKFDLKNNPVLDGEWQKNFINKQLMIPGPTEINTRVLNAMSRPILSHTDPQFYKFLDELANGIRYLFRTNNQYTFALTGSATLGMETALCNILEKGKTFLSLTHGFWGERTAMMSERLGFRTHQLKVSKLGQVFDLLEIEEALKTFRPRLIYVCHGDSSVCNIQPLEGIGDLCHRYDCLLMVDAVVSLCTDFISMTKFQIDVLYAGAQKALSGPPGVTLISFSDRAIDVIKSRTTPVPSYYMDVDLVAKAWGIDNNKQYRYHYTPAINLLYGLYEAIVLVKEEGLENLILRHKNAKNYIAEKIEQLGLELLVKNPSHRLAGIISVFIPKNIDGDKLKEFLYTKHDILIGSSLTGSLFDSEQKFWRIGFLGTNADLKKIDKLILAFRDALIELKSLKSHL